ncbi:hypothetical protein ACIPX0_03370 [Streptomyces sp. NPDC090075]|uniref:hypothetical protein n=1 Tax=Streptomyces sp. NPDC090075 TaxID=3365937 RepID=UPI0038018BB5
MGEARPGAGECVVLLLGTTLHCLPKGELPTSGQRWFRPASRYWVVNIAQESTSLDVELDSADKGLRFHGTVDVDWRIADAKQAVERKSLDVERQLRRLVMPRLSGAAKGCAFDAVAELEERLGREQFTGESGDGLFEIVDVTFDLRPDPGAIKIFRTGALDQMLRDEATKVLEQGEIGIASQAIAQNREIAVEIFRNMRDDKRTALRAQLEIIKAMHSAESGDERQQAHAVHELLAQLGRVLPGGADESLLPRSADDPRQIDGTNGGADPDNGGQKNRAPDGEE